MMQISQGTIGSPWHQTYHSSSSTSDLSGYNHEFLRRSPDQYSSRGSMESLDQAFAAYHHHLSPAKSTNCIDQLVHLHNKRDSAYNSFSTNASIPEYRSSPFSKERSYSMESMHSRNSSVQEGIKHADIKYIKTVYDVQRGISEEYEVNSSSVKNRNYSRQPAYNRNSIGPHGRLEQSRIVSESGGFERAAPMPPTRSDSYAVTRHHERPNSWSSLDQNRNFRIPPKAAGLQSTNTSSNSAQQPKHVHGDGHLHPVLERSPESSPQVKPKQIYSEAPQPGQPMLPIGIYPVPAPEPHFAHAPQPPKNNNGRLYPALAKEGSYGAKSSEKVLPLSEPNKNEKDTQHLRSKSVGHYPMNHSIKERDKKQEGPTGFAHYKLHFTAGPEISTGSLTNDRNDQLPLRLDNIDINEQQKNGTKVAEEFSVYAHPAFQNEWSDSKTKQDIASSDIMGLHQNSLSSDAHGEHEYHNHFNIASSSHNKIDERSNRQADHRKKLESLSFTVHVDEAAGPSSNPLKPDESPSPSQKKSYDFTRRRLSSSSSQSSKTDGNKLSSVFDKVCKIEQREHENQRSQFLCGNINQSALSTRGQNNKGSFTMVEEIRNKFISQDQTHPNEWRRLSSSHSNEKATGMHQLTRQGSVYGIQTGDAQKQMPEKQAEKMHSYNQDQTILQAVPDDDNRSFNSQTMPNKENDWQFAAQDTLGFNRAYRNSVKDAQCKVLEATSYRRKDLEISPPHYKKPEKNVRPSSAPFRKKSSSLSPHAPKERHSVTPTDNCASIQESQGVFFPSRIGAKRRITAEQKKRSYSEPEKINEVGASESESAPLTVSKIEPVASFSENSVADRRRIFEREGKACSTTNLSKPQLKQLQQNALADYIERKTGRRPSSQETRLLKERSQSTYFSGSIMDNQSMTSTSSMNSLHEHNLPYRHREPLSKTGRVSSTLPPGLTGFFDLSSFENNPEYPENRSRSSSFAHQLRSERLLDHRSKVEFGKGRETNKPQEVLLQSDDDVGITSSRRPGKSASAEDLLDRLPQPPALHVRSRSSPASDMKSREYMSRQDVGNKTSYASASNKDISFRSIKSNHFEPMSFQPSFLNQIDTGEEPVPENSSTIQRSAQLENQRNTKTQSISGIYSPHPEAKQEPLALPIHSVPAKVTQTSLAHATFDYITAEEYLYSGKRGKESASPTDNKEISHQEWCLHENSSSEDFNDPERFAKYTSAQRSQSFETKSVNLINETVQQNKSSGPTAGPKISTSWKSNAMWSSGSSEAETFNHGKISLHISESCLQPQSPMTGQEDEGDDEVFVKEQDTESFAGTFVPPSPPPFPPPSLEDALLKERIEKFPLAPNTLDEIWETTEEASTQVKEKSNERYLQCASEYTASTESSGSYSLNSGITKRDTDGPLLRRSSIAPAPEPLASSVDPTKPIEEQVTQPHGADTSILQSSEGNFNPSDSQSTLPHVRSELMSSEDAKSQELAKEIVTKDKSLANILDPDSRMKTTMDLMEGLFTKSSSALKEKNQKCKAKKQTDNIIAPESEKKEEKRETLDNAGNYSAYYSTSAPKAELRKMKTMHSQIGGKEEQFDVNEKKAELISSLTFKLEVLKDAKESLIDDIKLNNSLGEEVETHIETLCKPNEFDKYKMFIGDLDKVVNLLLSLSGRLARVENALSSLGEDASADERKTWNEKKKQLCGQHEDARELKENLDRREKLVMDILGNYLTGEEFAHYQHFVKMKSALLIEQRELDDKIKLGQEQLRCLTESLPSDYLISMKVSLPEERRSSLGNKSVPPPLTSSL